MARRTVARTLVEWCWHCQHTLAMWFFVVLACWAGCVGAAECQNVYFGVLEYRVGFDPHHDLPRLLRGRNTSITADGHVVTFDVDGVWYRIYQDDAYVVVDDDTCTFYLRGVFTDDIFHDTFGG